MFSTFLNLCDNSRMPSKVKPFWSNNCGITPHSSCKISAASQNNNILLFCKCFWIIHLSLFNSEHIIHPSCTTGKPLVSTIFPLNPDALAADSSRSKTHFKSSSFSTSTLPTINTSTYILHNLLHTCMAVYHHFAEPS